MRAGPPRGQAGIIRAHGVMISTRIQLGPGLSSLRVWRWAAAGLLLFPPLGLAAAEAVFYRAINLNGPALTLDGLAWDAEAGAKDFKAKGNRFENQKVPLRPPASAVRSRMIRSSVWGSQVDLELSGVPAGSYQVFLYVWEDNHDEQFDLRVNGETVVPGFHSGSAGMWKRLGPWPAASREGKISVSARGPSHGAANLSGLEVWSGDGPIPEAAGPAFVETPTAEQAAFFESKIRPVLVEH